MNLFIFVIEQYKGILGNPSADPYLVVQPKYIAVGVKPSSRCLPIPHAGHHGI